MCSIGILQSEGIWSICWVFYHPKMRTGESPAEPNEQARVQREHGAGAVDQWVLRPALTPEPRRRRIWVHYQRKVEWEGAKPWGPGERRRPGQGKPPRTSAGSVAGIGPSDPGGAPPDTSLCIYTVSSCASIGFCRPVLAAKWRDARC